MSNPHGDLYYRFSLEDYKIGVVGVGAVGSNLALSLVRQGLGHITIADFDRIERDNLSTTVYTEDDLTRRKVDALEYILLSVNDAVEIEKIGHRVENMARFSKLAVVFDCTDTVQSRATIRHKNVIHIGINDHYGEVCWDEHYKVPTHVPSGLRACDIPYSLNLILIVVGLAGDVLYNFLKTSEKKSFGFDLASKRIFEIK